MVLDYERVEALREEAKQKWNGQADRFNQWDELGQDEKDLAFAQVLLRHLQAQAPAVSGLMVSESLVERIAIAIRDAKAINPADNYGLARAALGALTAMVP